MAESVEILALYNSLILAANLDCTKIVIEMDCLQGCGSYLDEVKLSPAGCGINC